MENFIKISDLLYEQMTDDRVNLTAWKEGAAKPTLHF